VGHSWGSFEQRLQFAFGAVCGELFERAAGENHQPDNGGRQELAQGEGAKDGKDDDDVNAWGTLKQPTNQCRERKEKSDRSSSRPDGVAGAGEASCVAGGPGQ
jgi:hypothetical protein